MSRPKSITDKPQPVSLIQRVMKGQTWELIKRGRIVRRVEIAGFCVKDGERVAICTAKWVGGDGSTVDARCQAKILCRRLQQRFVMKK